MRFAALAVLAVAALAAPSDEVMGNLPDAPAFNTTTYSGYLTTESSTRNLHYVFAESESDPTTDPLVIWFNGGPGCSSMLAFMQENGPVVVDDGETVFKSNPYPWTTRANMLWIESPAGVGWSTTETEDDMKQNDMSQSRDAFAALQNWYTKFPEFASNSLYVSGESYGGIYVPYLAWQIYQWNLEADFRDSMSTIPLAGIMVGNGATNWDDDVMPSFPETLRYFNIIPQRLLDEYRAEGCEFYFYPEYRTSPSTYVCDALGARLEELSSKLNWYDLYRQTYPDDSLLVSADQDDEARRGQAIINGEIKEYKRGYTPAEYTPWVKSLKAAKTHPLLGDYLSTYMNRMDVRLAFNLETSAPVWEMCSSTLEYHEQREASFWIYPILKNQIKLMFYSGDTDGAITTYGTKRWIKKLDWDVVEDWRPWYTNTQVSGYVEKYDGLDFITVKGVGHMAPQWAREPVTNMIMAYIHDEDF